MGRLRFSTEKNDELKKKLGENIRKIVKKFSQGNAKFYTQYLEPLYKEVRDYDERRGYVNKRISGESTLSYEELLLFSDLAGVSINELLTEELDLDSKPRSLRDELIVLFTLLDRMYFKPHKVTSKGITGYIIAPRLKPTNVNDSEYNDYVFGSIVNEFLKEYEEQKRKAPEDYTLWRRRVLEGAYTYTVDGQDTEGLPTKEVTQIIERAKESRRKAAEAQKQADHEATEEREQYLKTHGFCGYTKEEWGAMPEEEQDAIYEEWSINRLEAMEESEETYPEDQETRGTVN